MRSYAVVALFEALDVGTTISRRKWPAHVTLASNFSTAAPTERVIDAVVGGDPISEPLNVGFGEHALFGPSQDVRVRLVDSDQAVSVHERLADQLESLPGFAAEEPAYWREGYRPHLTLGPSVTAEKGDRQTAKCVAVTELLDSDATVVALFHARGSH